MTEPQSNRSLPRPTVPRNLSGLVPAIGAALFAVLVVALSTVLWVHYFSAQTHAAAGTPVRVRIEAGASTQHIGELLAGAGVVANANGFALRSRLAGADSHLKPGTYDLVTGSSYAAAVRQLEAGPTDEYVSVTIPEGFRLEQVAARFKAEAGVHVTDFLKLARRGAPRFAGRHPMLTGAYHGSLEGYLFPKTYEVRRGASASSVIEMMLAQFDRETAGLDFSAARARGVTPQQVVTIASMIERESRLDRERPLVSAVIYNRLHWGRRLKIDATIEYVLRDRKFRLTNRDLYTVSPYNTYLHSGLPPGPISNPGAKSLEAAAHPADSPFLYYVLTGKDGSHTFTTNLADFLVAKRKSKEVFGR